jgi:hypothetical protein
MLLSSPRRLFFFFSRSPALAMCDFVSLWFLQLAGFSFCCVRLAAHATLLDFLLPSQGMLGAVASCEVLPRPPSPRRSAHDDAATLAAARRAAGADAELLAHPAAAHYGRARTAKGKANESSPPHVSPLAEAQDMETARQLGLF